MQQKYNYLVCPSCRIFLFELCFSPCCVKAILALKHLFLSKKHKLRSLQRLDVLLDVNGVWNNLPSTDRRAWLKRSSLNKNYIRRVEVVIEKELGHDYFVKV